jgi:RHS repeat-associated protein
VAMYAVGSGWYYYHYDGLGSVTALSDGYGNIVEQCSYDVFGEPSCVSGVGNPYKFTGRRYDPETGLYYYRARYYNPKIGRFMSPDQKGYSNSMNLYQYCRNNPVSWIDPSGLEPRREAVIGPYIDIPLLPPDWPNPSVPEPPGVGGEWAEHGALHAVGFLIDRGIGTIGGMPTGIGIIPALTQPCGYTDVFLSGFDPNGHWVDEWDDTAHRWVRHYVPLPPKPKKY